MIFGKMAEKRIMSYREHELAPSLKKELQFIKKIVDVDVTCYGSDVKGNLIFIPRNLMFKQRRETAAALKGAGYTFATKRTDANRLVRAWSK